MTSLGMAIHAALAIGLISPSQIMAQEATEKSTSEKVKVLEQVVVTARQLVETPSEEIKQISAAIVDSVTAEEIEKTPDSNLAEALDRVVGVSSDGFFSSSDAGYVSLRGFSSIYNSIDVDGSPITFTSQNNRGAQIGLLPSAIIKESSVYKTVTPDMDPNSVGGHISLRTLRAFDGGTQPFFKAGVRVGSPERESRINDGLSRQFYGAGKFTFGSERQYGFVFGANQQRSSSRDDLGSVSGYTQAKGPDGNLHDIITGNVFANSAVDKLTTNTAIFAKLETRVQDKLYAFLSGNFFDETRDYYVQRAGPYIAASGGRTVIQTAPGQAQFGNGQGQVREYDYVIERKAKMLGAGLDLAVAEKSSLVIRGNYTDYKNDTLTRNIGAGFRLNGVDGFYDVNGDMPIINPDNSARYNDPGNWAFSNTANTSSSAAYLRYQPLHDKIYSFSVDFNYNSTGISQGIGASAGAGWVRLDRTFDQTQDFYALNRGVSLNLSQITPDGSTMHKNLAAMGDYNAFWNLMHENGSSRRDQALTTDYNLREDTPSAHGSIFYFGTNYRFLAGVRYEKTEDLVDTSQVVSGEYLPLHRKSGYDNWLPNAQFIYEPTDRLKFRLAFTKTIGRPDFQDFAPGITTTFDANGVTLINGSNADLGPRISTNYDTSIEYYFDDGVIAFALFRKNLKDEIFRQRTEIFDDSGELSEIRTVPLNTGSASVNGIEITASRRKLDFLPAPFDRFGVSANYTKLDGEWNVVFTDGSTRTVGGLRSQPKWLGNLRVSFDAGPLDLNLNYHARGRRFTGTFGATLPGDIWERSNKTLDFQASYVLTPNLRTTFDVKNMTDTYRIQTLGIEDSLYNSLGAGRSYWFGLHYKL